MDVETDHVWAEAFSPDGELLATANDDDTVRLWYRATGAHVTTIGEHFGRVRSIAFRSDGAVLATGCDDRKARVWDMAGRRITALLDGHTDRVYAVALSACAVSSPASSTAICRACGTCRRRSRWVR